MKNVKWLCGLLILVLLFAGCQAPPAPVADENETSSDEPLETDAPQTESETTTPYVKRYAYPENIEYTAFLTGSESDGSASDAQAKNVYTLPWQRDIAELQREAKSEISVALGGRTWTGEYLCSFTSVYDNYGCHEYQTKFGETFGVCAKTGKLKYYGENPSSGDSEEIIDKEIIIEKAKAFVADLIDMDRYEIRYEWDENLKGHYVRFVKTIGEFETAEDIQVTYNRDGDFVLYHANMQDEFSDDMVWHMSKQHTDAIAMATAEDANLSFLTDERYERVDLSIRDCRLVLTEDGRLGACYQIVVTTWQKREKDQKVQYAQGGHITEVIVFDTVGVKIPTAA